jgi:RNA polymerase sigma factor (sigma-70 family)
MEDWAAELEAGRPEAAWDRLLERYQRLIFAAIRHYADDHDDVMDIFAWVCEALRADDLRRLRSYLAQPQHRARFSTWLVTVVRHLAVDWFRHRDGRRRLSDSVAALPVLQRSIFQHVFLDRRSHVEAYELIRTETPALSFREYLAELRATYRAVTNGRRSGILRELGGPPPPDPEPGTPGDAADTFDARRLLAGALAALSDVDRVAIELYVVEELPAAEVARMLGLPNAKAVYNRVHRALEVLRGQVARSGARREDV